MTAELGGSMGNRMLVHQPEDTPRVMRTGLRSRGLTTSICRDRWSLRSLIRKAYARLMGIDLVMVVLMVGFFLLAAAFVVWLDKI